MHESRIPSLVVWGEFKDSLVPKAEDVVFGNSFAPLNQHPSEAKPSSGEGD
jgi:hypothetical protein